MTDMEFIADIHRQLGQRFGNRDLRNPKRVLTYYFGSGHSSKASSSSVLVSPAMFEEIVSSKDECFVCYSPKWSPGATNHMVVECPIGELVFVSVVWFHEMQMEFDEDMTPVEKLKKYGEAKGWCLKEEQ